MMILFFPAQRGDRGKMPEWWCGNTVQWNQEICKGLAWSAFRIERFVVRGGRHMPSEQDLASQFLAVLDPSGHSSRYRTQVRRQLQEGGPARWFCACPFVHRRGHGCRQRRSSISNYDHRFRQIRSNTCETWIVTLTQDRYWLRPSPRPFRNYPCVVLDVVSSK